MAFRFFKQKDYEQTNTIICNNPGITQAELARQLGKNRSTIKRRLATMEDAGYLYSEDEKGKLYFFGKRK